MLIYGKTDVGKKRLANQDDFIIKKYAHDVILAVVCDGMGGANGGNVASAVASQAFAAKMDEAENETKTFFGMTEEEIFTLLKDATAQANAEVYEKSTEDLSLAGMGTTLVGCLLIGDKLYVVNIGDSRLYLVRETEIEQISHDHSYVQFLVDAGKMTPEEAKTSRNKNLITRAVGTEQKVEADVFSADLKEGDRVVLCSDGLTNMVEDGEIADAARAPDPQFACETLVELANKRGGLDNITAVILCNGGAD